MKPASAARLWKLKRCLIWTEKSKGAAWKGVVIAPFQALSCWWFLLFEVRLSPMPRHFEHCLESRGQKSRTKSRKILWCYDFPEVNLSWSTSTGHERAATVASAVSALKKRVICEEFGHWGPPCSCGDLLVTSFMASDMDSPQVADCLTLSSDAHQIWNTNWTYLKWHELEFLLWNFAAET